MSIVPPVLTRKRGQPPNQSKQYDEIEETIQMLDVAPVKRRRSTVEEQAEQIQQMSVQGNKIDGSPEGEIFRVTVKTRDELQGSEDAAADAQKVAQLLRLKQLAASTTHHHDVDVAWGHEYQALDLLRCFSKHHQEEARRLLKSGILKILVLPAASNLRSVMARNALLCIQDLILDLKTEMASHLSVFVPVLLCQACSEKQFLSELARRVLDTTLQAGINEEFLQPLLDTSTTEKNAQIVSVAGLYVTKCVIQMDRDHLRTFVLETRGSFVDELAGFLNCKVVECKAATRRTCQHTRRLIGNEEFVALVKEKLSGSAQLDVLKASEIRKSGKASHAKMSFRDRMLQMKKQQQQQKKVQSGGNDIAFIVVAPPRSRTSSMQTAPSI
ncbi:CLASP N-terminal domain [Plasmopara halstedii]|uniref:CLASP N-terminal domain n=1 Tax=Plasmopara halstedii TaxID=4781 RepID=A0A0P1AQX4_PLAHL|nr:CLASP N-terminal domain [Plasmopara halstedii]CEG43753.1 CLASP N-terminal domain [Plasmopara halstedii]|eukprot:XP_024580122.1 CLASP N-terminal domain [Plasmopara halstedii]